MYLRTMCDKMLFLSLHPPQDLIRLGLPSPLDARPGIGSLTQAGREFEEERNNQIVDAFGSCVQFEKNPAGKYVDFPLLDALNQLTLAPKIFLQPKFDVDNFQTDILTAIGLDGASIPLIPSINGFIPDVLLLRSADVSEMEILPNGSRIPISQTETRISITIIDIKHTSEANPSYSAEIALYALMMSNWLTHNSLNGKYFVSSKCYLWTKFKQGESSLENLLANNPQATLLEKISSLINDCEDIPLNFYIPVVLRFFREDLPRVIQVSQTNQNGWRDLEWHVDTRCSSCDWLGLEQWANAADRQKIAQNPDHYCYPLAMHSGHLSRIPGMTRGGRKTLQNNAVTDIEAVSLTQGAEPFYQLHSMLKRESPKLPFRASALISGLTSNDNSARIATLSQWAQVQMNVTVNFDPSSGLLTGLSITGRATGFVRGQNVQQFQGRAFVVDNKTLDAEWDQLEGFLSQLAANFDSAERYFNGLNIPVETMTAQIAFWEKRQFEELCGAMGRHLPRVFNLVDERQRALAWLFPAEELLEQEELSVSPVLVFISDIVKRVVFAPTPHAITLFGTAEHYHPQTYRPPIVSDPYYREFLTNGIPRERIYEIWSGSTVIHRGSSALPRNTIIAEYSIALLNQSKCLGAITDRLRSDYSTQLRQNAPRLSLRLPTGIRGVAYDSKLWRWWDELEHATNRQKAQELLSMDIHSLESSYEAIRLLNGRILRNISPAIIEYEVPNSSIDAKFDDDASFLTIGCTNNPGFPLMRFSTSFVAGYQIQLDDPRKLHLFNYSAFRAKLLEFDRTNFRAIVEFELPEPNILDQIIQHGNFNILNEVFLVKTMPGFDWSDTSGSILREVATPTIAYPDPNSIQAMRVTPPRRQQATPVTPISRVLWDAANLFSEVRLAPNDSQEIAAFCQLHHNVNPSQAEAIKMAAERALSLIWGPPGTGKTNTLAAFIHGFTHYQISQNRSVNILITGPTYKAVEEVVSRTIQALAQDPTCPADIYLAFSRSRIIADFQSPAPHLTVTSFHLDNSSQEWHDCERSLLDQNRLTIVATPVMQAYKFSQYISGSYVSPVFDVVIIDESSQVSVTKALSPLATLREVGRVIIAGDHLQMPPIFNLDPPANAEYLVGSIQTYLMEREFNLPIIPTALVVNYRSNQTIVNYARTIGYPQDLRAHFPDEKIYFVEPLDTPKTGFPGNLPWSNSWSDVLDPDKPVITILHDDDLSSQNNIFEAKIVAALVQLLKTSISRSLEGRGNPKHLISEPAHFWDQVIGIVTPHRAQRALITRELRQLFPLDPAEVIDASVDTVEKFQGGERHIIIISFGVGDTDVISSEEEFLMQLERTNVAVSRAMAKCIVIMPTNLARFIPQDKKALQSAHALKGYVDEFCSNSQDIIINYEQNTHTGKIRWA